VTILNLNCRTKSKFLEHVAFVPDCVEIHKPSFCWLWHIAHNAYKSIFFVTLLFLLPQGCPNTQQVASLESWTQTLSDTIIFDTYHGANKFFMG
jgi:hypothetical protein